MIACREGEKFVRANNLIPMYNLILRWPFQSMYKLPTHIQQGRWEIRLHAYELLEKSWTIEQEIFYHIKEIKKNDFYTYHSKLGEIVFLLEEVEAIEDAHPEYKAYRDVLDGEYAFYAANTQNINIVMSLIFCVCKHEIADGLTAYICRNILSSEINRNGIDSILKEYCIDEERIYPPQLECFATVKPLTLFEKAQKFVSQRPANSDCERSLLFLELERRFPELKREDVGKLLYYDKKKEGMEGVILPSSYAKRYDRTREDAHIYRKLA